MTANTQQLSPSQRWMLAIRPKTLPAAISPVLVGCGIAISSAVFQWLPALAALFGSIMIQIGTNLVNDVVDYGKGADTEERLGPTRVTQAGLLSPRQVWAGAILSFVLAALAGVYLIFVGGLPILIIGIASIVAGILYTAGPSPLAYNGLADIFVMLFFGFVAVLGTVYVVAGVVPVAAWLGAAGVGALIVNILVVNNIRDIESDRKAGRRNIPVVWGRRAAEIEYLLMLALAYGVVISLAFLGLQGAALALFTFPAGYRLYRRLEGGLEGPLLNPVLGQTAQLSFLYSLLLAGGLVVQAIIFS
ncbi:MAG: 1,4-dihydroxy-2-naphthoate polyprenyltransferase [Chloroflexi bacterium]|nr:MAG: 1,4-dihydroxy-2-naphthoate polyprenyltransferase [Chloroflexota bacterium]MBL1195819.1 1,4-dihydroxy-2-naphthoate polyprenyltransferase [Chloroflexota bacterium]NOH13111.1 1,4-dihydroxy-2-naphthoate polyprenyltransferase [Chloroflexota bacterium]